MSATEEVKEPKQILLTDLANDVLKMREAGFWPAHVECGPLVFEFFVEWAINTKRTSDTNAFASNWTEERILAREVRDRKELWAGLTNIMFEGLSVKYCEDVPDGRLWPAGERQKTTLFSKRFQESEAKYGD